MKSSTYKKCNKCGVEKPHAEFSKRKSTKDGLNYTCKACNREYYKKWHEENKEYKREYDRKYCEENKEHRREYTKKWREKNPEYKKNWYEQNKEQALKSQKKWAKNNPHTVRATGQRRRARKKGATVGLTDNERLALQILTEECILLGPGWHLDHIVPLSKGGKHHPDNLQIVRASYNQSKYDKIFNTRKYY